MRTRSSILSTSARVKPPSLGSTAPNRKAPNSAWMPMSSVAQLDRKTSTSTTATAFCGMPPSCPATRAAMRATSGRTSHSMTRM